MTLSLTRPSVTVVVPNYNHARYLDQCLASIVAQSRQPDRVIFIDDASTDDSLQIVERFARQRPSWRVIANKVNRGVVPNQNDALAETDTEWISYLGADDVLHPDYLATMMKLAASSETAGLLCACAEQFGPSTPYSLRPIVLPKTTEGLVSPERFRSLLRQADNFFLGTVSTYRCAAVRELDGFDPELGAFSDAMLSRRLAVRYGFSFAPRVLGYWRMQGENYSTTTAMDADVVAGKLARVRTVIAAEPSGLFPKDYGELFDRRQRFGGLRLLALEDRMPPSTRADKIATLLQAGRVEKTWISFLVKGGKAGAFAVLAWLTLRMRPMSLRMLLAQMRSRRAISARESGFRPR